MWTCRSCLKRIPTQNVAKSPASGHVRVPSRAASRFSSTSDQLPRVANPSVWHSVIPRFLREWNSAPPALGKRSVSTEWNPATFYIVIFLLIGSNAINLIALRNDFTAFSRRTDAKIGLLREVIQRVQNGEDVDVEGLLGTGDPEKEREWEEVMKEIEQEDLVWKSKEEKRRARLQRRRQEQEEAAAKDANASPTAESTSDSTESDSANAESAALKPLTGFY